MTDGEDAIATSTAAIIGTVLAIGAALFLLHSTLKANRDAKRDRTAIRTEIGTVRTEANEDRAAIRRQMTDGFGAILARLPAAAEPDAAEPSPPADTALPSPASAGADTSGLTIAAHALTAPAERDDK